MSVIKRILYHVVFIFMTFFSLQANLQFSGQAGQFVVDGGSLHIASPIKNWKGTLALLSGNITGNSIVFNDGGVKTTKGFLEITGEVSPAATPSIILRDGNKIVGYPGVLIDSLDVRGAGNILSGQPDFQSASSLVNSLAELQINISNRLSQSIAMNNGTITLLNDLTLADDVTLSGSGTINFNERRLSLPGKLSTWSNDLVFYNPTDITLNSKTVLSGKWTFSGLNGSLQGNGNVLDLTSGGTLQIAADQEVQFTDLHIKGLGQIYGSLIFDNTSSRIRLSNCSLQISTSYSLENGGIIFEGVNSSIITGTNTLYLASSFGLTVDNITVLGDALDATSTVNLSPNIPDGVRLTYLNNGTLRSIANNEALSILAQDNSTAIVGWIQDTSNVVVSIYDLLIETSNATVSDNQLSVANSWAILNLDERVIENSWAIENLDERVVANSDAIITTNNLAVDNSTSITGWIQDTSNVMISTYNLVVNNSEAIVTGNDLAIDNSWAILNLDERVIENSWAIQNLDKRVVENSWAIENLDERVVANSDAIVTTNNLSVDNSTSITGWIQDTSNVMISTYNLVVDNSEAIVTGNDLAIDNSWAILNLDERVIENSWAIENLDERVVANSDAIVTTNNLSVDNSTSITGWIQDTSNVMISTYNLVVDNSEAIVTGNDLAIDNSWAILNLDERVIENSWAIQNLDERVVENSWAIENLDERVVANSDAIVTTNNLSVDNSTSITGWIQDTSNVTISTYNLVINNSDAIVTTANLSIANSGAIISWIQDTSNVVNSCDSTPSILNALGTIDHGPAHIHMTSSITMSFDVNISVDHRFEMHSNGIIDGAGHFINFAIDDAKMMVLDSGITVTFVNVELFNYADDKILFNAASDIVFGTDCTVHVHASQDISRLWRVAGYASLYGGGSRLTILDDSSGIEVGLASQFAIHDVCLSGVSGNRLRCMVDESTLLFDNAKIILDNDYSFTKGSMSFYRDVTWAATVEWSYESAVSSFVHSEARLIFDRGLSWRYYPASTNKLGLVFTDSTSQWLINGNSLDISSTGIQLTKGRFIIDDANTLIGNGSTLSEAIIFGNGIASDDIQIELLPAAEMTLSSGIIDYQNIR